MIAKRLCVAAGALTLVMAGAQQIVTGDSKHDDENGDNQHLEGSFVVSISLNPPGPPGLAPGLVTYSSDGSVIANEIVNLGPLVPVGTLFTEDHGTWRRIGNGKFLVTFIKLASLNGQLVASLKTRAEVTLSGATFKGKFRVDVINPSGVSYASLTGNIDGKRIEAEPVP